MKINLVIEDKKGKNLLFITDTNQALTLDEAIVATRNKTLENIHVVNSDEAFDFIRSNPNKTSTDNLDALILSYNQLEEGLINYDSVADLPVIQEYEKIRLENIKVNYDQYLLINGSPRKTKEQVIRHIEKHKSIILAAARSQDIDPVSLGAILIDEYLRKGLNDWFDWAAKIGIETTIGIGQVNIDTARNLVKQGLYSPNPDDKKLSPENIDQTSNSHLYKYLKEPLHSVNLTASKIRYDINHWEPEFDIANRPDILGTTYSQSDLDVHDNPIANDRGKQIANEFYPLIQELFSK